LYNASIASSFLMPKLLRPVHITRMYGPFPYVRPVRTARTEKSIARYAFLPVRPVHTGGVYGTPVYVARNVIPGFI